MTQYRHGQWVLHLQSLHDSNGKGSWETALYRHCGHWAQTRSSIPTLVLPAQPAGKKLHDKNCTKSFAGWSLEALCLTPCCSSSWASDPDRGCGS